MYMYDVSGVILKFSLVPVSLKMKLNEEAKARAQVWNHAFGYIKTSAVKSAIELQIPDIIDTHVGPISLSDLSSAVGCPPQLLHRLMRFLIHHGIFKKIDASASLHYAQTPLSHLMTRENAGPFVLLQGSPGVPPGCLTAAALRTESRRDESVWAQPFYETKVFTEGMSCHARMAALAIIDNYADGFEGIGLLVDVGGNQGMALGMLVKAFPWVRGIAFDLPETVARAPPVDGVRFVGGDMFDYVPRADAVMLMSVLHDWGDEACIDILKKCREAIPIETGKVMIVEAVIDEEGDGDEYTGARLSLDLTMMAVTAKGKERTYREWAHLIDAAGFTKHNVKNIKTVVSVIEAFP